jgi:hypothetical protein
LSACGGGSSGGGGNAATDTTPPTLADGDSVKAGTQSLTVDSTSGSAYKLSVHFNESIKVDTSKTDIGSYITVYRKKAGESDFTELTGSISDLSVENLSVLGSGVGRLHINLNENGAGAGEDYSLEGSTYRVKFVKVGLVSDSADNDLAKDTETSEAEAAGTDKTSPVLASKNAEVKKVEGEENAREIVTVFNEDIKLVDASKIKLFRVTSSGNTKVTPQSVKVSGKEVIVKFAYEKAAYKVIFEEGSISDTADNLFTPSGTEGETIDIPLPKNTAPVFKSGTSSSTLTAKEGTGGVLGLYDAEDGDGDTLTYTLDGDDKADFSVNNQGLVSWKVAPVHHSGGDNSYNFSVVARDGFGGEAVHSVSITIRGGKTLVAPQKVRLYAADDTLFENPVDTATNKSNLTVLKTTVENDLFVGDSVEFFSGGTTSLGKVTLTQALDKGGEVTLILDEALTKGSYSITAKVTIVFGVNKGTSSASESLVFELDDSSPDAPFSIALTESKSVDNVLFSKDDTPSFLIEGLKTGETAIVYSKSSSGTLVELGRKKKDAGLAVEVTVQGNKALDDGVNVVVAKIMNIAGNLGDASPDLTFTLDTEAPDKPLIAAVVDGVRGTDNTWHTKLIKPDLQVSGLEGKGSVVRLYDSGDLVSPIGSASLLSGTSLNVTLTSSLSEREHNIVATEIDKAGNESSASVVLVINVDLTPPGKPTIILYGEPSANPIFRMDKLERDAYVTLYERIEGGADKRIMGQTAGGPKEQFIPEDPFSVGVHTVYVKVVDVAGNESAPSDDLPFTVPASSEWVEGVGFGYDFY